MNDSIVKVILLLTCLPTVFSCYHLPTESPKKKSLYINGTPFSVECSTNFGELVSATNEIHTTLHPRSKRCEIASKAMRLPVTLFISFDVELSGMPEQDGEWFSIFQVHSFPDKELGEAWRCPVLGLEVLNSKLRMFNRWDQSLVSSLSRGTCASPQNSISSRALFNDVQIENNRKFTVELEMFLSFESDGYTKVRINDVVTANVKGPNTYNDNRGTFIKIGIYKPTSWKHSESITAVYKNLVIGTGITD